MEIKNVINEYCNPVTSNDLIKIIDMFDDIEYDEYMPDIHNIVEVEINNDINNIGMLIHNIVVKHSYDLLLEIGFTINKDVPNLTVSELKDILYFIIDLKFISKDNAEFIYHTIETYDDVIDAFSRIFEKYINMQYARAYDIFDKIDYSFVKDLEGTLHKIMSDDTYDIPNYDIANVIRELKLNDEHEILGLRLIRNEFEDCNLLVDYIKNNINDIKSDTYEKTAINILSLIILSVDGRLDIKNVYVNNFEDMFEDEYFKANIYTYIKNIEPKIYDLYTKYKVKDLYVDYRNGEDKYGEDN